MTSAQYTDDEKRGIQLSLETTSTRIAVFSKHLFGDPAERNIEVMSPFVPYSIYHAAVIQYRLLRRTADPDYQRNLDSLISILQTFKKRWLIAGKRQCSIEKKIEHIMQANI
jgi:hypothetical protein